MDTKSRKSSPWAAWLCFFLAVNIIGGLLFTGLAAVLEADGDLAVLKTPFTDYRSTRAFKQQTSKYFNQLMILAGNPASSDTSDEELTQNELNDQNMAQDYLNREGANLRYYASNNDTGLLLKSIDADLSTIPPSGSDGYTYLWYYDGQKIHIWEHGEPVDIKRLDSGYQNILFNEYEGTSASLTNGRVMLAVRDTLVKNPYGHSTYYQEQQFLPVIGWVYIVLGITGIVLLVYALLRRRDKRDFEQRLAVWSGKLWFEAKALFSLLLLSLTTTLSGGRSDLFGWILSVSFTACCILFVLWWFYLMFLDLIANKRAFFTHNIINSLITWYRRYERKYPWQKGMLKRA